MKGLEVLFHGPAGKHAMQHRLVFGGPQSSHGLSHTSALISICLPKPGTRSMLDPKPSPSGSKGPNYRA